MRAWMVVFWMVAACSDHKPSCVEGQSSACACPNGSSGAQVCSNGAFGACTCIAPPKPTDPPNLKPADPKPVPEPAKPVATTSPAGYQCGAGKPLTGSGCSCPADMTPGRDDENIALCVTIMPATKPPVVAPAPGEITLIKVAGDDQRIAPNGWGNFSVRAVGANRKPIAGARIAWSTPALGSNTYIGVTDGKGVSSATNLFTAAGPAVLTQVAGVAKDYQGGEWSDTLVTTTAKVTFKFALGDKAAANCKSLAGSWTRADGFGFEISQTACAIKGVGRGETDPKGTRGRDLDGFTYSANTMTGAVCRTECQKRGFAYAGTQYASHCFCGSQYGKSGAASNCDTVCAGDPAESCGGAYVNTVYATGTTGPALGCFKDQRATHHELAGVIVDRTFTGSVLRTATDGCYTRLQVTMTMLDDGRIQQRTTGSDDTCGIATTFTEQFIYQKT